jgi:RING finger protein 121
MGETEQNDVRKLHAGHQDLHTLLLLVLILLLVGAQISLVLWKKKHYRSYQLTTLAGMYGQLLDFLINRIVGHSIFN